MQLGQDVVARHFSLHFVPVFLFVSSFNLGEASFSTINYILSYTIFCHLFNSNYVLRNLLLLGFT